MIIDKNEDVLQNYVNEVQNNVDMLIDFNAIVSTFQNQQYIDKIMCEPDYISGTDDIDYKIYVHDVSVTLKVLRKKRQYEIRLESKKLAELHYKDNTLAIINTEDDNRHLTNKDLLEAIYNALADKIKDMTKVNKFATKENDEFMHSGELGIKNNYGKYSTAIPC